MRLQWVGYVLGTVMLVLGGLVLGGYFQLRGSAEGEGEMLRTVFGIVLMLYGIYRLAITDTARRKHAREARLQQREESEGE